MVGDLALELGHRIGLGAVALEDRLGLGAALFGLVTGVAEDLVRRRRASSMIWVAWEFALPRTPSA